MTATRTESPVPDAAAEPITTPCSYCGSPLTADQEWCLECGAAQTLIHGAPDWRIPVAIVATVVCLALISLAIVLINLSATANDTTPATARAPAQSAAPAASTPAAPTPRTFAGWPVGLGGWTVVLARARTETLADASASRFAEAGVHVGVLDASQHPSLPAGFWFVFSGRYPDRARAETAAATLRTEGQTSATAIRVAKPGGL